MSWLLAWWKRNVLTLVEMSSKVGIEAAPIADASSAAGGVTFTWKW